MWCLFKYSVIFAALKTIKNSLYFLNKVLCNDAK